MVIEMIVGIAVTWPIVGLVFGEPLSRLAEKVETVPVGTFLPYVDPASYPDGKA